MKPFAHWKSFKIIDMRILKFCTIMLFALAIGAACNQDDSPPEPDDPDETKRIDTPDIFIQEKLSLPIIERAHYFKTDTVVMGNTAIISTPKKYDSYKWWIGQEARFRRGQKIKVKFIKPVQVKVRLYGTKANKKPDTLTKLLTVIDIGSAPLIDTFKGYNKDNPKNTFKIYFAKKQPKRTPKPMWMLYNLTEGCKYKKWGIRISHNDLGYKGMVLASSMAGCRNIHGKITFKSKYEKIEAKYEVVDSSRENWIDKTFIGTKVE